MSLSMYDRIQIANELLGSCSDLNIYIDQYNLDPFTGYDEVVSAANEYGVWLCDCCGWWYDESEIYEFQPEVICEDCQEI